MRGSGGSEHPRNYAQVWATSDTLYERVLVPPGRIKVKKTPGKGLGPTGVQTSRTPRNLLHLSRKASFSMHENNTNNIKSDTSITTNLPTSADPAQLLPLQQAAEESACSVSTLRNLIARGDLTAYRFGPRMIRVRRQDLEGLLKPYQGGHPAPVWWSFSGYNQPRAWSVRKTDPLKRLVTRPVLS